MANKWYENDDGKKVYGAAAEQHIIKQNGGWDAHHEKFAEETQEIMFKELAKKQVRTSQLLRPEEQRIRRVK